MPTELERMEQALEGGQTLAQALQAVDSPAQGTVTAPGEGGGQLPPGAQASAATKPDDLDPYLANVPESLREIVRPSIRAVVDSVRAQAATANEAESQLQAMHKAFSTNPRGAVRFLAEHYKVPVRFADEAGDPAPTATSPQRQVSDPSSLDQDIAAELQRIETAANMGEVARAVDRLTTLRAARMISDSVAPVAAAQLSQEEARQLDRLRADHPDIPVDTLLPQIKARQAVLRSRPYLTPEEGLYIEVGPTLLREVRRLKAQTVRTASPAEKAAAGVSGPGASAPAAAGSFDPYALTPDQLMDLMVTTGGVSRERD